MSGLIVSLPVRERGLKLFGDLLLITDNKVAPRAGAWIETVKTDITIRIDLVAPRAGAWIETTPTSSAWKMTPSLPVRERGLKRDKPHQPGGIRRVAPRAGAWIETPPIFRHQHAGRGRSPCGSVD